MRQHVASSSMLRLAARCSAAPCSVVCLGDGMALKGLDSAKCTCEGLVTCCLSKYRNLSSLSRLSLSKVLVTCCLYFVSFSKARNLLLLSRLSIARVPSSLRSCNSPASAAGASSASLDLGSPQNNIGSRIHSTWK